MARTGEPRGPGDRRRAGDEAEAADMTPDELAANEAAMEAADSSMRAAALQEEKDAEAFTRLQGAVEAEKNAAEESRKLEQELAVVQAAVEAAERGEGNNEALDEVRRANEKENPDPNLDLNVTERGPCSLKLDMQEPHTMRWNRRQRKCSSRGSVGRFREPTSPRGKKNLRRRRRKKLRLRQTHAGFDKNKPRRI